MVLTIRVLSNPLLLIKLVDIFKSFMIRNQSELLIKDNSGILKGRCINIGKSPFRAIGDFIKISITRSKSSRLSKNKNIRSNLVQDLLIIQTKKPIIRYDGSTIKFNQNCGVCVNLNVGKGMRLQLGFKRIKTTVPFELKGRIKQGSHNFIKLGKNLV